MDDSPIRDEQSGIPVPLKVLAGFSIAVHVVLFALYCISVRTVDRPELPSDRAWSWYLLVGSGWSVFIGLFGLSWGARATTRFGGYGSSARVGWCLAGVWLGYFWPIPVTAAAVVFAVRKRPRSRAELIWPRAESGEARRWNVATRGAAVVVAGVVGVVGPIWGFRAHAVQLHPIQLDSGSGLLGTWISSGGSTVELRTGGTYVASDLSAMDYMGDQGGFPASTGTWSLTSSSGQSSVVLRAAPDRLLELPVYQASSVFLLCAEADADSPCDVVFRRG